MIVPSAISRCNLETFDDKREFLESTVSRIETDGQIVIITGNIVVTAASGSDNVMPTPGLCRVGLLAYPIREGSLIRVATLVGIITRSPEKRARRPEAESGQARGRMGWRAPVLVP